MTVWLSRLMAYLRPRHLEERLDEELSSHLDLLAADYMRRGLNRDDAAAAARRDLGGVAQIKEMHRDARGLPLVDPLLQDLRYAGRQLRKNPGFAALTIATLAIGIGVNAAMFTVIDGALLRPIPYSAVDRIITLQAIGQVSTSVSFADVNAWRQRSHSLEDASYYTQFITTLDRKVSSDMLMRVNAGSNLFRLLGARPMMGRDFTPVDQEPGAAKVVILPEELWRTGFHSRQNIVGSAIKVGGQLFTVVGVMPKGFHFPSNSGIEQLWAPLSLNDQVLKENFGVVPIARVKPGISIRQAATELEALQHELNHEDSHLHGADRLDIRTYRDSLTKDFRPSLFALDAAVAVVWLIACVNVAGMMFVRVNGRRRELAVRNALGAGKWRLVRQLLCESLLTSAISACLGVVLGYLALDLLKGAFHNALPVDATFRLSPLLISLLTGGTIISAILIGILPAWRAGSTPPLDGLHESSARAGTSRMQNRVRDTFVVAEVALSVVLLVSAGLMLRTLYAMRHVALGFEPQNVIATDFFIPEHEFDSQDVGRGLYDPLLSRVRGLPGVRDAAITSILPVHASFNATAMFEFIGRPKPEKGKEPVSALRLVSPNIHSLLGIRLLRGRFLSAGDGASTQPVAVVNEAFARKFFPNEDPLGRRMRLGEKGPHSIFTIVGITDNVHQTTLNELPAQEIDIAYSQLLPNDDLYFLLTMFMQLAIRTEQNPAAIIPPVRSLLHQLNPDLAIDDFKTMRQVVDDSLGNQALAARLLMIFAGIAVLIAAGGLYALLAFAVTQRTKEIGVRVALGAARETVFLMVLRHACLVTSAGLALGIAGVWLTGRLLRAFIFGVPEHDWVTLSGVAALMLAVSLCAAFIPARRAASVDPVVALRHE